MILPISLHSSKEIKNPNTGTSTYQHRNEGFNQKDPPELFCDILINPLTPLTLQREKFPN